MFRQGIVVATHPEDHSVDLVMMDDGSRLVGVQVSTPNGSSRSGSVDMPAVPEKKDKWDITKRTEQDQIALVGFVRGYPVVTGFLYPQISQMTFDDPRRRVDRHQSDVYSTIDGNGNAEWHHPSGAFVRIAENPEHEDLAGKNFDKNFAVTRNADKKVNFRLSLGGAQIDITHEGDVTIKAKSITFDTPRGKITGSFNSDGDVVAGSVSLKQHQHTGTMPGGGLSGPPSGGGGGGTGAAPVPAGQLNSVGSAAPVQSTGPDGQTVFTYPISSTVTADQYGNRINQLPGVLGEPLYYIQAERVITNDAGGITSTTSEAYGPLIITDAAGNVLPSVSYQTNSLVMNESGQLQYAPPTTVTQAVPSGDPLPGTGVKFDVS